MQPFCNRLTNGMYEKYFTCFQGLYCGTSITEGFEKRDQASYERKAGKLLNARMSVGGKENAGTVDAPN